VSDFRLFGELKLLGVGFQLLGEDLHFLVFGFSFFGGLTRLGVRFQFPGGRMELLGVWSQFLVEG
jgi:hypothetical protein